VARSSTSNLTVSQWTVAVVDRAVAGRCQPDRDQHEGRTPGFRDNHHLFAGLDVLPRSASCCAAAVIRGPPDLHSGGPISDEGQRLTAQSLATSATKGEVAVNTVYYVATPGRGESLAATIAATVHAIAVPPSSVA
jgi:hypothetical protein